MVFFLPGVCKFEIYLSAMQCPTFKYFRLSQLREIIFKNIIIF